MDELPNVIVNILEETGYPDSIFSEPFKWMSNIDKLFPFYKWLIKSVTKDNFIKTEEIIVYNSIVKSGKKVEDDLDSRLSKYYSPEKIFINEVSVDGLNSAIATKKKVLQQLNLLKSRLKDKVGNKEFNSNGVSFVDQIIEEEIANAHNVEQMFKDQLNYLGRKIQFLLDNIFIRKNNDSKYIFQQDLTPYLLKNATLDVYTEILKKKIFQKDKSEEPEPIFSLGDRVNEVFYWLRDEECRAASYKAKELAADEALKYLADCGANINNINFLFENKNKYSCTENKPTRPHEDDLLLSCEFYLRDIIRGIQLDMCEEKLSRKKKNLLLLEELEKIVGIRKLCNSSLYYLLINEWKMIRMSVSLVKDVHDFLKNEISEYEKRMVWMHHLIIDYKIQSITVHEHYEEGLSRLFSSTILPVLDDTQYQEINSSQHKEFSTKVAMYKENISNYFKTYLTTIRNINSEILKVDRFIFNGPSRTVQYSEDIVTMLREIQALKRQPLSLDNEIKEFRHFKESLENNLYHMMWYEWNKDPFNVMQAVLKMEESVDVNKRRLSMIAHKELASFEFKDFGRF